MLFNIRMYIGSSWTKECNMNKLKTNKQKKSLLLTLICSWRLFVARTGWKRKEKYPFIIFLMQSSYKRH